MMKKRIVALLLAGLMSATALASCRVQGNKNPNGTEPNQNPPTGQTTPDPNTNVTPPVVTWQDVNKSVFTINDVKLRQEANGTSTALVNIPKEVELHCTKQSTSWYYVEYVETKDGQETTHQGYVSKASVTEIDILGTDFVDVANGPKVMYANAKTINVRLYPSEAEFSSIVGSFSLNKEVTVISTNGTWYKVKYIKDNVEKNYYVHGSCLSEAKVTDPNDDSPYKDLFTDVEGTPKMFVGVDKVNFRKTPSTNENVTIIMSLSKGCEVTVLKTGTVAGKEWSYVKVDIPNNFETGVPAHSEYGYISSDCLSTSSGSLTLQQLLDLYSFEEVVGSKTMYVLKGNRVNVRYTPFVSEDAENIIDTIGSNDSDAAVTAVKVVAMGTYSNAPWCIIEHTKKENNEDKTVLGFVSLNYLTSSPSGEKFVSLDTLLDTYSKFGFVACDPTRTITAKGKVLCYENPEPQDWVADSVKELAKDTQVTLVAEQTGNDAKWYIIQETENGPYYFVAISFFN